MRKKNLNLTQGKFLHIKFPPRQPPLYMLINMFKKFRLLLRRTYVLQKANFFFVVICIDQ